MRGVLRATLATAVAALAACGGDTPPSPAPSPGGGDTITGRERFGWVQPGADAAEVAGFQFALYVNGVRRVLAGAACAPAAGAFDCSAPLPSLNPGSTTLELATFFLDGSTVFESARSAPLQVTVTGLTAPAPAPETVQGGPIETPDGVALQADVLLRDLVDPVDVAVAADGRVLVAGRHGDLHVVGTGHSERLPARTVSVLQGFGGAPDTPGPATLSLALAPDFAATRLLYVASAALDRGRPAIQIVRLREAGGAGAQAALIGTFHVTAIEPAARLRFGPDGALYLAIASGWDPEDAQSISQPAGKVIRLQPDGTTPRDNPFPSPVFSLGHRDPRGLAWLNGAMWEVEAATDDGGGELNWIRAGGNYGWPLQGGRSAGTLRAALSLPPGTEPSGLAAVFAPGHPLHGELVVSASGARDLLRIAFAPDGRPSIAGRILDERFGRIGGVASAEDGTLYFVTANADVWGPGRDMLIRLAPAPPRPHAP